MILGQKAMDQRHQTISLTHPLNFQEKYGKRYRGLREEQLRKKIFTDNFNLINEHNEQYAGGLVTFSMKINQYSDMTIEEISRTLTGYKGSHESSSDLQEIPFVPDRSLVLPSEVDWREDGAVTPVKNQKMCGSCWAFSAVGALEGQYFLKTGNLVSMSEQNIVDCSKVHNKGCVGGDIIPAFAYVKCNDGIDSEDAYPYIGLDNECAYNTSANVTSLNSYRSIKGASEEYLKAAVATLGPISATIDAEQISFIHYKNGVHYNSQCIEGKDDPENELNHAVLIVGYGKEDGEDYWLVKNSWGMAWGDNGYIKMARNKGNNCGIASLASVPAMY
ncbi:hypothetical protein NQ318_018389 [Aromia moschata]|uniref:Cathepsin L n=1 Tax=Aromia moschata TaxID=1265417 RepID=A0AAV8ZD99_9CUCU|nr:hypothetical protein NQ318_018389 [Aromia moschata]